MVEVDRVDVGEVDERLDVDRARLARLRRRRAPRRSARPAAVEVVAVARPPRTGSPCPPRRRSGGPRSARRPSRAAGGSAGRGRARALYRRDGDVHEPELSEPDHRRARHQRLRAGLPQRGRQVARLRRARSSSAGSSALPVRLALDHVEHRLAVGVLVAAPGRSLVQRLDQLARHLDLRCSGGLRARFGASSVVRAARSRRRSASCAARAARRAAGSPRGTRGCGR